MASFSERHGYKEVRSLFQRDSLDDETRMELWNCVAILPTMFDDLSTSDSTEKNVLDAVWVWDLKQARDERPYDSVVWRQIKETVLHGEWTEVLDQIETLIQYLDRYKTYSTNTLSATFVDAFNGRFEHYLVGYRFIGHEITPIDSVAEADAVSEALTDVSHIKGARHHLERAVELLADRNNPDYPNSIKESISAVESVCKALTDEKTLGPALKKLTSAGLTIHPVLESAWSKMYGWTSDADGIRHGSIDSATADQSLAKYMLVTCSAFVSLLVESARKVGLM